MPTIQQERGVKTVAGLPLRWGRRAYRELSIALREMEATKKELQKAQAQPDRIGPAREDEQYGRAAGRYQKLAALIDEVTAAPLPLDATDAHLCVLAARYANDCSSAGLPLAGDTWTGETWDDPNGKVERVSLAAISEPSALRARMEEICRLRGIEPPKMADHMQAILRCTDPMWWRRGLRKTHGRTFEAAAIRLGFVSVRAGAYASDETVARRISQVARNKAALESVKIENEDGYGLAPRALPIGVYERIAPDTVYASTRYTWTRSAASGGFDLPRSPVNNCTDRPWAARPQSRDPWSASAPEGEPMAQFTDDEWYASDEFARYWIPPEDVAAIEAAGDRREPLRLDELSEQARAAFAAQSAYVTSYTNQGKAHG
jgi:hypothetical protein